MTPIHVSSIIEHPTTSLSAKDYLGEDKNNPHHLKIGDHICVQFIKLYANEMPAKLDNQWFTVDKISRQGMPLVMAENKLRKVRPGHVKAITRNV